MLKALDKADVEPMNAAGMPLDLERHEVLAVRVDPSVPEDTVLEEALRGYLWKQRLLRRARVVISRCQDSEEDHRMSREKGDRE
jgi:molecular chaperone GrpE